MTEPATPLAPYRVSARNTARESENKIHDDATARRFDFRGGLVPGVDVYAYMTHMPVARWGRAWLERGTAECRFLQPVYDGAPTLVEAAESAGRLEIRVESGSELCATGVASLASAPPAEPACIGLPPAEARERPPADEASLALGRELGLDPFVLTPDYAAQYLADLGESATLYAEGGLVHPGTILRLCNWVLSHNVVLGPWIHVGSTVQNLAAARVGDTLSLGARVRDNYTHKDHRFVAFDAVVRAKGPANGWREIARIGHTAIYRPRQVDAA